MNTSDSWASAGFAAWCTLDGKILRIVHDSLGLAPALAPDLPVALLVEPQSLPKLLNFLLAVQQHGAAFDWELNVPVQGEIETLHFAGAVIGGELFISGARSRSNLWNLYDELIGITNDQANLVRSLLKDMADLQQTAPARLLANAERDDALYDEISRLNNELVNLQRELAKKTVELERLNALKNQFLGMAVHDLRNPLGAILSFSQFILESAASRLNKEEMEYLSLISSQADLMLDVVNDLLDIAAIESGKLQLDLHPVDLSGLVEHVTAVYRPLAATKHIEVRAVIERRPPPLMLDSRKMEQVLHNLLSNAIKYSYPNTIVAITLTSSEDEVLLAVRDQGQGIPANEIGRLFQPFAITSVRTTGGEKSTGLGLTIAKKVIEAHGGRIEVESCVGSGSTFTIVLPNAPAAASSVAPSQPAADGAEDRPLRILLAEDNLVNQRIALKLLERLGYQADVAATGAAVLAAHREHHYDLILMDIYMPEMDGLEATQRIRAEWPPELQPTIVALTASISGESRNRCLAVGMDGWLEKATLGRSDELRQLLDHCPRLGSRS